VKLKQPQAYQEIAAKKREVTPSPRIAKIHEAEDKAVDEAIQDAWVHKTIKFSENPGVDVLYALPTRHDFYD
jgi:hypothetical protein